jgi:hypothetical protein
MTDILVTDLVTVLVTDLVTVLVTDLVTDLVTVLVKTHIGMTDMTLLKKVYNTFILMVR